MWPAPGAPRASRARSRGGRRAGRRRARGSWPRQSVLPRREDRAASPRGATSRRPRGPTPRQARAPRQRRPPRPRQAPPRPLPGPSRCGRLPRRTGCGRIPIPCAARQELLEAQRRESESDHSRFVEEAGRTVRAREGAEAALAEAAAAAAAAALALAEVSAREADVTSRREGSRRDLLSAGARSAEATNRERDAALLVDRLGFALAKLEERRTRATSLAEERRTASADAHALLAGAASGLDAARRHLEEASHGRRAAEDRLATLKAVREAHVAARTSTAWSAATWA